MTRYPWPYNRPPNDPEMQVFLCLLRWAKQHPEHPALTAMSLHAHTRLDSQALAAAIHSLTTAHLIQQVHDPMVPGPDRWALT